MDAIYLSAAHKSSGKTTVMLGLCAALVRNLDFVQPFKKGPDYIDPAWLSRASNSPCYNLDFYTQTHDEILDLFWRKANTASISIVEGNKGLYDGMDINGSDSNAALAKLLGLPVVLVIDTMGMTRGIAPLLMGYQNFDKDVSIAGVILNRVGGPRHEAKLRESVQTYTDIPVLGAIPRIDGGVIEERHLGLVPADEARESRKAIESLANIVADHVDLDVLCKISKKANPPPRSGLNSRSSTRATAIDTSKTPLKIGIARDEAFGFYYADDLEAFTRNGTEVVSIDLIRDRALPELDGLFIGGGFPETNLAKLERNRPMRESIKAAIEQGLPCYAECGGLMYLAQEISWNGQRGEMVGVVPGTVTMSSRPHGRGYIQLRETVDSLWPGGDKERVIAGHEFHYSQLEGLPDTSRFAYDVLRGTGIVGGKDGFVYKNLLASYAHLRDQKQNHWVKRFLAFIEKNKG